MSILSQLLSRTQQSVVYWAPAGFDSHGRPKQATPVQIHARWVDELEELVGPQGAPVMSSAKCYSATPMLVGGLLMQGTLDMVNDPAFPADPRTTGKVFEIITVSQTPSIYGTELLVQASVK
jgi:hypothetical protein